MRTPPEHPDPSCQEAPERLPGVPNARIPPAWLAPCVCTTARYFLMCGKAVVHAHHRWPCSKTRDLRGVAPALGSWPRLHRYSTASCCTVEGFVATSGKEGREPSPSEALPTPRCAERLPRSAHDTGLDQGRLRLRRFRARCSSRGTGWEAACSPGLDAQAALLRGARRHGTGRRHEAGGWCEPRHRGRVQWPGVPLASGAFNLRPCTRQAGCRSLTVTA